MGSLSSKTKTLTPPPGQLADAFLVEKTASTTTTTKQQQPQQQDSYHQISKLLLQSQPSKTLAAGIIPLEAATEVSLPATEQDNNNQVLPFAPKLGPQLAPQPAPEAISTIEEPQNQQQLSSQQPLNQQIPPLPGSALQQLQQTNMVAGAPWQLEQPATTAPGSLNNPNNPASPTFFAPSKKQARDAILAQQPQVVSHT